MKCIRISAVWCPSCLVTYKNWMGAQEQLDNMEFEEQDYDFLSDFEQEQVGDLLPVYLIKENDQVIATLKGEKTTEELIRFFREVR